MDREIAVEFINPMDQRERWGVTDTLHLPLGMVELGHRAFRALERETLRLWEGDHS